MPLLVTCCPLLGEQELTLTPRQRGGAALCGCPSCTLSWRPHLLLSRASHATIQQPQVAATGVQDNMTKPWRPAEIKPSWAPPSTSARTLLNTGLWCKNWPALPGGNEWSRYDEAFGVLVANVTLSPLNESRFLRFLWKISRSGTCDCPQRKVQKIKSWSSVSPFQSEFCPGEKMLYKFQSYLMIERP